MEFIKKTFIFAGENKDEISKIELNSVMDDTRRCVLLIDLMKQVLRYLPRKGRGAVKVGISVKL